MKTDSSGGSVITCLKNLLNEPLAMPRILTNILLFQIGWFACVLGAAYSQPLIGSSIAIMIIAYHLYSTLDWQRELLLILIVMLIGFFWDSLLVYQGWISYSTGQIFPGTAPYWIVVMWGLFTTTLNVSMKWLNKRLLYSICFGLVGGPLAYLAGSKLGALEFIDKQSGLIALAVGWGVITPSLLALSQYISHFGKDTQRKIACKG